MAAAGGLVAQVARWETEVVYGAETCVCFGAWTRSQGGRRVSLVLGAAADLCLRRADASQENGYPGIVTSLRQASHAPTLACAGAAGSRNPVTRRPAATAAPFG